MLVLQIKNEKIKKKQTNNLLSKIIYARIQDKAAWQQFSRGIKLPYFRKHNSGMTAV